LCIAICMSCHSHNGSDIVILPFWKSVIWILERMPATYGRYYKYFITLRCSFVNCIFVHAARIFQMEWTNIVMLHCHCLRLHALFTHHCGFWLGLWLGPGSGLGCCTNIHMTRMNNNCLMI